MAMKMATKESKTVYDLSIVSGSLSYTIRKADVVLELIDKKIVTIEILEKLPQFTVPITIYSNNLDGKGIVCNSIRDKEDSTLFIVK